MNASLSDKMVLSIVFSAPILFSNGTGNGAVSKRQPCDLILDWPILDPSVFCRISGDGLEVTSDSLRTRSPVVFESVNTTALSIVSVLAGRAPMPSLSSSVALDASLAPQVPLLLQLSSCGNMYINWSLASGNGGKPFISMQWTVTSNNATQNAMIVNMLNNNVVPSTSKSVAPTMTALNRYELDSRFAGRVFGIQLSLTNWLGLTGRTTTAISIRFDAVAATSQNNQAILNIVALNAPVLPSVVPFGEPQYTLSGPLAPVSIKSDFFLEIVPTFPVERCLNGSLAFPNGTRYPVWTNEAGPFPRGFRGTALRGDAFKLVVYSGQLGVGSYVFGAQLSKFQNATVTVNITVDSMPVLLGGNRSLDSVETGIVSLDSSYLNSTIFDIRWFCRAINYLPATPSPTPSDFVPEDSNTGALQMSLDLADPNFFFIAPYTPCTGTVSSVLNANRNLTSASIPAAVLALDTVYVVFANLTLYRGGPILMSLPSYFLRTGAIGGFSVEIDSATQPIAGRGKVNINAATAIRATSRERGLKYQWAQVEGDLNLELIPSLDLTKSTLRFPANSLSPGRRYAFSVSAVNSPQLFATITFVGNSPPSGGFASVTPLAGVSGETNFFMSASFFVDEDLPLSYSFLIARRDCFSSDCFPGNRQSSLFQPLTPFFPDPSAVTQLSFWSGPQTIGCTAQDALGAVSQVVLVNSTVSVTRPTVNSTTLISNLRNATSNPQDGSLVWNNILAALSNINGTDITNKTEIAGDLSQALDTARKAASFAPQRMSSLVIENQINAQITQEFSAVLQNNTQMLQSTVSAMTSVLDRAIDVLKSTTASASEGEVELVRSLTSDTLTSSSKLLDSISNEAHTAAQVSIPQDVVAKLVQVQLNVPLKVQVADPNRFFTSKNIDSSFVARSYEDFFNATSQEQALASPERGPPVVDPYLVVSSSQTRQNSFVLPTDSIITQLDQKNNSLAFASAVLYKINPFAREANASNQSVLTQGINSLEVYDAQSMAKLASFGTDLRIVMEIDPTSNLATNPSFSVRNNGFFEANRTVSRLSGNRTIRVNLTDRVFCGFFDYDQRKWSTVGCWVEGFSSSAGLLACKCNHTTDYTAWMQTINEIVITFTDVSNFNNPADGAAILGILLAWAFFTVGFYIWGIRLDDRDTKRRVRGILFSLKMRRLRDLRTRNRVFRAWRCETLKQGGALVDSSAPLPPALSSLVSLERRNKMVVMPPKAMQVDLSTAPRRLWHFFYIALYREHTLLSTIYLLDPFLTRPMRVLCGAAVILGEMFGAALFFYFDQSDDITIGTQIIVAILGVLIVSPVVALFVLLTRRVAASPGAQRTYLSQMMVVLIAEMGEDRKGDDVKRWATFAKSVTWKDFDRIHRYQALRDRIDNLKRTGPMTAEKKALIKELQDELNEEKRTILRPLTKDESDTKSLKTLERANGTSRISSRVEDGALNLQVSGNTTKWLETVSSASPEHKSGSSFNALRNTDKKDPASASGPNQLAKMYAFTPRPFHAETPRAFKSNGANVDDEDSFKMKAVKCCRSIFCKPIFWCLRARPSSWNRVNLPPPVNDFHLSAKWIYVCYAILFVYYCVAFFFVLSWGFRGRAEAVAAWIPTVALSIFLDLIIIQPLLIFIKFSLMNEVAFRMEGQDAFLANVSWRQGRDPLTADLSDIEDAGDVEAQRTASRKRPPPSGGNGGAPPSLRRAASAPKPKDAAPVSPRGIRIVDASETAPTSKDQPSKVPARDSGAGTKRSAPAPPAEKDTNSTNKRSDPTSSAPMPSQGDAASKASEPAKKKPAPGTLDPPPEAAKPSQSDPSNALSLA